MYSPDESKHQLNVLPEQAHPELLSPRCATPQFAFEYTARRLRDLSREPVVGLPIQFLGIEGDARVSVESLVRNRTHFGVPHEVTPFPRASRLLESSCGALLG